LENLLEYERSQLKGNYTSIYIWAKFYAWSCNLSIGISQIQLQIELLFAYVITVSWS